ncbi:MULTISPECIES: YceI family protein [Aquimarina]|uniref:YceI family protein n=1 Tax=Aquimarina algiphila TaxID=2047982 RepID=A0A554VAY9_9FLAO|nr:MULTISPECIES: YceI family protein [Aquimarina]TSE03512.1 YceI family protein [Aquimarina algiphila]
MKALISILLTVLISQGFAQTDFPNEINISNNTSEYALINDYRGLTIDKEKSRISFDFVSEETSGTISGLDFKIDFNPSDPDNASFSGTALIKTLDTDNFLRDGHLMWEKFFYKKKYPKIKFESTQVVPFDTNTYKVIGMLTIKETKKEVIITFSLDDKKLLGKTTIYTSDFGVNIHDEREKNKLDVRFYFPVIQ